MAIDSQIRSAPVRFGGLPGAIDRTRALRSAKRHSARVRTLRWLLPVLCVCVAALYFLPMQYSVEIAGGEASVKDVVLSDGGLKMVNPRIKGVHEKYGVYDIRAEDATQQIKNPELMTLNVINAEIVSPSGQRTVLTAPSGLYQQKLEELTFDNGVLIGGDAGIAGKLKTATAYMQSNKLVSTDPVDLAFHSSTIKAQSMTYYSSEGRAIFEGNVKVHLERQPQQGAQR
ncbi:MULTISPECIES: LPS export ABC transporter periplasmic protein LptC [Rhodomicrobium]|uniref:LPS export ABC transporter periplasmic protein LptC n=1 Tax=Rhodomicrobium TaxID=1068 RepID=UPI000B4BE6EE|nr:MULTISPECIES: LPS export ABC transporter periplasmic protein LptC [Rhodomicrobium]